MNQSELFDPLEADVDAILAHIDDLGIDSHHVWPQTLADLMDVLAHHFKQRRELDETGARDEAQQVILLLAHYFGGRMVYLPRDTKLRTALRDNLIWQEFNGRNVPYLADRYDLTVMQLYNIIRQQRKYHTHKVQRDLFGDEYDK